MPSSTWNVSIIQCFVWSYVAIVDPTASADLVNEGPRPVQKFRNPVL